MGGCKSGYWRLDDQLGSESHASLVRPHGMPGHETHTLVLVVVVAVRRALVIDDGIGQVLCFVAVPESADERMAEPLHPDTTERARGRRGISTRSRPATGGCLQPPVYQASGSLDLWEG